LLGCITNIRWRWPACDRAIADYSGFRSGFHRSLRWATASTAATLTMDESESGY
jgi:hypothetical protein